MKEESPPIEQESSQLSSAVPSPTEKSRKVDRSSFLSMVHIVAVGLPLLVIWFAQPGTSKWSLHRSCLFFMKNLISWKRLNAFLHIETFHLSCPFERSQSKSLGKLFSTNLKICLNFLANVNRIIMQVNRFPVIRGETLKNPWTKIKVQ